MSWVSIAGLRVAYGSSDVLDGVDLEIPRGSLVAVLGPSGSGKTTLLRAIAGLLPASGGTIRVDDRLLSSPTVRLAPEKRGVGWVPQDASLFPHLSVADNIAFGLPRRDRETRVAELARLVGLSELLLRAPSQLSGGQAQRVALARALAPRPDLILLDEPFGALDPQLRATLRTEVAELLRQQKNTSLLVTHDQQEALSLADFIAVMRDGRILQWGTPAEIYESPSSSWVASFIGDVVTLDGRWSGSRVKCALGTIDAIPADGVVAVEGSPARVMLRPEWLRVGRGADAIGGTPATVSAVAYAGHDALIALDLASGSSVTARVSTPGLPSRGETVAVSVGHRALAYPIG